LRNLARTVPVLFGQQTKPTNCTVGVTYVLAVAAGDLISF